MPEPPDDRRLPEPADGDQVPLLFAVVDGKKFPRPALTTYFVDPATSDSRRGQAGPQSTGCACDPVGGTYCSCNKVCRCVPACSCVGHSGSGGGGGGGGCRCAPVH